MKIFKPYTNEELIRIKSVVDTSTNYNKSAITLAKEFGRSPDGIINAIYRIKSGKFKRANNLFKIKAEKTSKVVKIKEVKETKIASISKQEIRIPFKGIQIVDSNLIITY